MKNYESVFQPIKIGRMQAKNRIEVAPASPFLASHDGAVTPALYEYFRSLARSGAAIVTLGVTAVDPVGRYGSRSTFLGKDFYVSDYNEIAEVIHSYGALAAAEMVYSHYMLSSPQVTVNETTTEDVEDMISCFVRGVDRLQRAGFDIALIHGGHGNVPAMFFSQLHNHRIDRFGGSFENRCRFSVELLQAIREKCGDKIAIEYRISAEEMLPGTTTLEETIEFAKVIDPYIDLLHVSRGLLEVDSLIPYINAPLYLPQAMNLPFARKFKEALKTPITVVGSFNLELAERAIASGDVDMVSMIRTIYADTDCVEKARCGNAEKIRPCIRCNVCIDRTHNSFLSVRCSVNPLIGRESHFNLSRQEGEARRVAIIGGGPAGLEAARTLSKRGHKPVIFEREAELGGLLRLASAGEMKKEIRAYLDWSIADVLGDSNIEVNLEVEATPNSIESGKFDVILLALGAKPIIPVFSASGTKKLMWIGKAENNQGELGNRILIAGAGMTGMEFALSLARQGKEVTLIDMLPYKELGIGGTLINLQCLKGLLEEAGVRIVCECKLKDVTEEGAIIIDKDGNEALILCDNAVLSFGFKPDEKAMRSFEEKFTYCYRIGDCAPRTGTLFGATQTAFDKAMNL
jgi:2,4-dienoyl-CoA reductase-like NADH-dependent reductase (Old Yellow Enzyme family)/thioredoxin reductase